MHDALEFKALVVLFSATLGQSQGRAVAVCHTLFCCFALQAIAQAKLPEVSMDCLAKAHEYLKNTQVGGKQVILGLK